MCVGARSTILQRSLFVRHAMLSFQQVGIQVGVYNDNNNYNYNNNNNNNDNNNNNNNKKNKNVKQI